VRYARKNRRQARIQAGEREVASEPATCGVPHCRIELPRSELRICAWRNSVDVFPRQRDPDFWEGTNMIAARLAWLSSILILAPLAHAAGVDSGPGRADELRLAKEWNDDAEQYMNQGAYEEARRRFLRSLPVLEKKAGPYHPATATALGNLCIASSHSAYLDAKPLCARALSVREKVFGPNHPEVARSLSDLGLLYAKEGDLSRAESLIRRALAIDSSLAGSPDVPALSNNLGFLYFKQKKYARAEEAFEHAIAATERNRGPEDPDLVTMLGNAGTVYLANHQWRAAERNFRRALAIAERSFGPDQVTSVRALTGLARAEAALGNSSEADAFRERARRVVARDRQAYVEWGDAASLP
jgi:tetratricopeptide (TPR) repeat protein